MVASPGCVFKLCPTLFLGSIPLRAPGPCFEPKANVGGSFHPLSFAALKANTCPGGGGAVNSK